LAGPASCPQADGSRPIQLASRPLAVSFARWSPDGKQIAFAAAQSGDRPMRLYLVDADGGSPRIAIPAEQGSQGFPTWSPDGKSLLYGIVRSSLREELYIRVADLKTGKVTRLDGSEGLFAPRWSPDGRMIAAPRFAEPRTLRLFDVKENRWENVAGPRIDWPTWAPDSKSLIGRDGDTIVRYWTEARKFESVAEFKPEEWGGYSRSLSVGIDNQPMRTLNRDSRQIYAIPF
jgi:Tol biopolymer transport system component